RLESVEEREPRGDAGYAVQIGLEARHAQEALSPDERLRVEEEIFRLADSVGHGVEPATNSLVVPGTRIALRFDIDHEMHRIRIVEIRDAGLASERDAAESAPC